MASLAEESCNAAATEIPSEFLYPNSFYIFWIEAKNSQGYSPTMADVSMTLRESQRVVSTLSQVDMSHLFIVEKLDLMTSTREPLSTFQQVKPNDMTVEEISNISWGSILSFGVIAILVCPCVFVCALRNYKCLKAQYKRRKNRAADSEYELGRQTTTETESDRS